MYSAQALDLVDHLHEVITHAELPDALGPDRRAAYDPLPETTYSEIVGLLEYLNRRGGREDLFRIATDTNREFGRVITVVKAAEMLQWVSTPRRLVVLEADGRQFVRAAPPERKVLWGQKLLGLRLFQDVFALLQNEPRHQIDRDLVLETMVLNMPQENYEKMFQTFMQWARFGDLFTYDEKTQMIALT
jgi:NitT/TauT family transport system ATP-binding protein